MNRKQRRTDASRKRRHAELAAGVLRVHHEAQGRVMIYLMTGLDLLLGLASGDRETATLARAGMKTAATMLEATLAGRPMLCGCCPAEIGVDFVIMLAVPARAKPENAMGFALCPACIDDPAAPMTALRRCWPDFRELIIHRTGGSA
jgi:hypothetical protein